MACIQGLVLNACDSYARAVSRLSQVQSRMAFLCLAVVLFALKNPLLQLLYPLAYTLATRSLPTSEVHCGLSRQVINPLPV